MLFKRLHVKDIFAFSSFVTVFIVTSILASHYAGDLKNLVAATGYLGIFAYVLITIISDVIGPITAVPLIPVAVNIWGEIVTGVLSVTGWTIGAMIVFWLTRRYGKSMVARMVNMERIEEIGNAIPQKKFFWAVVFLRIVFPVDILSYALGLFTTIHWLPYLIATVVGITPFAFILAYGVTLPVKYQLLAAAIILIAIIFFYGRLRHQVVGWLKK